MADNNRMQNGKNCSANGFGDNEYAPDVYMADSTSTERDAEQSAAEQGAIEEWENEGGKILHFRLTLTDSLCGA